MEQTNDQLDNAGLQRCDMLFHLGGGKARSDILWASIQSWASEIAERSGEYISVRQFVTFGEVKIDLLFEKSNRLANVLQTIHSVLD
jgi:hypothetical protein